MNITTYSRRSFIIRIFNEEFAENSNVISINDSVTESSEVFNLFLDSENKKENILPLVFEDDYPNPGDFTSSFAESIIEFSIKTFKEKRDLKIHCSTGVSRSVAIAKWANDYFNLEIEKIKNYENYNKVIYSILDSASKKDKFKY